MKISFILFLLIHIGTSASSQINETYRNKKLTVTKTTPAFKLGDINKQHHEGFLTPIPKNPRNEIPVLKFKLKGEHESNNGKGADIYIYSPYNMPVLKPDATFKSNMPVTGKPPLLNPDFRCDHY